MVEFLLHGGTLRGAGLTLRAAHGRGGITLQKREGDGGTPAGLLPLVRVLYRADRLAPPRCAVPVEPLSPQDGWCDDPADAAYNKPVRLPCPARHEALWREDRVYDIIGVLGWNLDPVVPGRGSAIFFHIATPDYGPTEGCVALAPPDMRTALAAGLSAIRVATG
ncbi:L,D-transpeptidase family protein [Acidocella sp.]|uniref:L,D-transpeptidase family protein n=1 Tax=Acidocella sp. TaxID=50710 RepID=UPI003CFC4495